MNERLMSWYAAAFAAAWISYTAYCAAYGPPYNDAYGKIIHAAWQMWLNS